jgi:hypothetical protein
MAIVALAFVPAVGAQPAGMWRLAGKPTIKGDRLILNGAVTTELTATGSKVERKVTWPGHPTISESYAWLVPDSFRPGTVIDASIQAFCSSGDCDGRATLAIRGDQVASANARGNQRVANKTARAPSNGRELVITVLCGTGAMPGSIEVEYTYRFDAPPVPKSVPAPSAVSKDLTGRWCAEADPDDCLDLRQTGESISGKALAAGRPAGDVTGYARGDKVVLALKLPENGELAFLVFSRGDDGILTGKSFHGDGSERGGGVYRRAPAAR